MAGWNSLSTRQKVALALGVSAGAAVICVCYAKYRSRTALEDPGDTEDEYEVRIKITQHAAQRLSVDGGDHTLQFPKHMAAHIEVSQGADSEGCRELTIRGSPAQVHQVLEMVLGILKEDGLVQVELHLPTRSVSRLIGSGDRIREIGKTSGAKIQWEQQPEDSLGLQSCITITGSREQVNAAKSLIQKVSKEETSIFTRGADPSSLRAHRKQVIGVRKTDRQPPAEESVTPNPDRSPDSFHTADSPEEKLSWDPANKTYNICKFEVPSPDFNFRADEFVDVYVSAAESPDHFWIQILGSRFLQLDKLTTEMNDFYLRQKPGEVTEFQVGDIVAAQFRDDSSWYRAEVLRVPETGKVELYYVDYGDSWVCPKDNLFPLRSDFLSLPFQAVECGLASVRPVGGKWSGGALDAFDSLSHCAKWRLLLAKIASFPSPGVSRFQIHLYDPSHQPMLDIGQALVTRGFALQHVTSPENSDEETLVSRVLTEVMGLSKKPEPSSFTSRQVQEHHLESEVFLNSSADDVILVENDA